MKKIIYPVLIFLLSFGTVSATESNVNNKLNTEKSNAKMDNLVKQIKEGNYEKVKTLLESGSKVNEKSNGLTPLMFAARYNRDKIAKLLIGFGADTKMLSDNGKFTALKLARISKSKET